MKSFKHFLKHRKKAHGSWQVEGPADDKDIANRVREEIKIGFGTIHVGDPTDHIIPVDTHQRTRKVQEDSEGDGEDHLLAIAHKHSEIARNAPHDPFRVAAVDHKRLAQQDSEEFAHHHELNRLHAERQHKERYGNAISSYTTASRFINHHLIAKHRGPEHERDYLESTLELHGNNLDHTKQRFEDHINAVSQETNHPGNALKKPTVVHSGPGHNMQHILKNTKVGEKIHFPAFTSATTDTHTAFMSTPLGEVHHDDADIHQHHHIMHFHLPAGYQRGRHVANISTHPNEHEMILDKGQTFHKAHEWVEHRRTRNPTNDVLGARKGEVHHITHHHFVPVDSDQSQPSPITN